jgi:hypothetical protein
MMLGRTRRVATIAAALVLVLALATCVPAGTDESPHGAAGIMIRPSPASRGQPLATADGWTIWVDRLAVQVLISAHDVSSSYTGGGALYAFSAASDQQFVIRALPVGQVLVGVSLTGLENDETEAILADPPAAHGIGPDIAARFQEQPDSVDPDGMPLGLRDLDAGFESSSFGGLSFGPTIVIAVHAEKGERIVTFDLSLGEPDRDERRRPLSIQPNAVANIDVPLDVEALFTNEAGVVVFDDIAAADIDGSGQISPEELRRLNVPPCPGCTEAQKTAAIQQAVTDGDELATKLIARSKRLFGP